MLENSPADATQLPTGCQPESLAKQLVAARTRQPAAAAYVPRELDGRTSAAKAFGRLVGDIESDLGGSDRLSAIERVLVEGFAGAAVTLRGWVCSEGRATCSHGNPAAAAHVPRARRLYFFCRAGWRAPLVMCLCDDCRFKTLVLCRRGVEAQIDGHLDLATAILARPDMTDFMVAHVCRPLWCDQ
jgi:hypothetical protein